MPPAPQNPLRAARQKAGLTQRDVARRLGIAQQSYAKWELGGRIPEHHRPKLAQILGTEIEDVQPVGTENFVDALAELKREILRQEDLIRMLIRVIESKDPR